MLPWLDLLLVVYVLANQIGEIADARSVLCEQRVDYESIEKEGTCSVFQPIDDSLRQKKLLNLVPLGLITVHNDSDQLTFSVDYFLVDFALFDLQVVSETLAT